MRLIIFILLFSFSFGQDPHFNTTSLVWDPPSPYWFDNVDMWRFYGLSPEDDSRWVGISYNINPYPLNPTLIIRPKIEGESISGVSVFYGEESKNGSYCIVPQAEYELVIRSKGEILKIEKFHYPLGKNIQETEITAEVRRYIPPSPKLESDFFTRGGKYSNTNYGNDTFMHFKYYGYGNPDLHRNVVFSFSNVHISSGTLTVFSTGGNYENVITTYDIYVAPILINQYSATHNSISSVDWTLVSSGNKIKKGPLGQKNEIDIPEIITNHDKVVSIMLKPTANSSTKGVRGFATMENKGISPASLR